FLPPIPAGDRSAPSFAPALGAALCRSNHPNDPRYSTLFAGLGQMQVACDGSNINPVALNILRAKKADGNYYIPGSINGTFQQVQFTRPARFNERQYIANVDYLPSSKHTLAMRYLYSHDPQTVFLAGQLPGWMQTTLYA